MPSLTTTGAALTVSIAVHNPNGSTSTYSVTPPADTSRFFDIIGTNGNTIARIIFTPLTSLTVGVDNFAFGTAAPAVPEPSSVALLMGMGVSGTAFLRRRRNACKAA